MEPPFPFEIDTPAGRSALALSFRLDNTTTEDFAETRYMAKLFPGAVLCFATFREALNAVEIKGLARIVLRGRKSLRTGKLLNPVLILTGKEPLSQFRWDRQLHEAFGDKAKYAEMFYMRRDIEAM